MLQQYTLPSYGDGGRWTHATHFLFPYSFRRAVWLLLCGSHIAAHTGQPLCPRSPLHLLPSEIVEHICHELAARWFVC